jgi:hypothetical protein
MLIYISSMISVKDYLEREHQKMSWLQKAVRNYPAITSTAYVGRPLRAIPANEETIVRPSLLKKIILLPLLLFAGFFYYWVLKSFLNTNAVVPFIFGLFSVTALFLVVLWFNLLSPRYNYKIILNASEIKIRHDRFGWEEVEGTYIMTRMEGKYRTAYLLLFTKRNTVEKFDLSNLGTSHQKLASLVEYYKKKNKEPESIHPG